MESFSKVEKLLPTKKMAKNCIGNNVIFYLWFKFLMRNVTGRAMLPDSTIQRIGPIVRSNFSEKRAAMPGDKILIEFILLIHHEFILLIHLRGL